MDLNIVALVFSENFNGTLLIRVNVFIEMKEINLLATEVTLNTQYCHSVCSCDTIVTKITINCCV